jgi:sigma-B regulation protein RsbU (phosphoserine phosphatase)
METTSALPVRDALIERRRKLAQALATMPHMHRLHELLHEVDAALERVDAGRYGLCETCHEPIEPERLAADPLVRYCIDHLTPGEQRALQEDLDLTARIQADLLPRPELRRDGWEASYHYEPLGPASGDCCDLLPLDDGGLFFLLGDVMGKGLAASMLMAHLQAIFRSLATAPIPLADLAERANRVFTQSTASVRFATLVFGRLHPSGEVELVNAGHCPPILIREGRTSTTSPTGLPFGLFTGAAYESSRSRLAPDDALLLYTDGVTEATNDAGEEYGAERLEEVARDCSRRLGREIVAACLDNVSAFRGAAAREDDQTLLVLKRVGER